MSTPNLTAPHFLISGIITLHSGDPVYYPERRGPGRPRTNPVAPPKEKRGPGRPRLYPASEGAATGTAALFSQGPGATPMPKMHDRSNYYGPAARVWEAVPATKALLFYPELDPGFLDNKFRWGSFKRFAISKGKPVMGISYPAAAAYGQDWLIENRYARLEDGVLSLRKRGVELYDILFKGRGPRDFRDAS